MPKQAEAGRSVHLNKGEDFEWTNHGERDCDITNCSPPLDQPSYHVRVGQPLHAKVTGPSGTYEYSCSCHDDLKIRTNPHIIIA